MNSLQERSLLLSTCLLADTMTTLTPRSSPFGSGSSGSSLLIILFLLAFGAAIGTAKPAAAQREVDAEDIPDVPAELHVGYGLGSGNWRAPTFDGTRSLGRKGLRIAGFLKADRLWIEGNLSAWVDRLQNIDKTSLDGRVRKVLADKIRLPAFHVTGKLAGLVAQGRIGGVSIGAKVDYSRRQMKLAEEESSAFVPASRDLPLDISRTVRVGGLLALHTDLSPPGRLMISGGAYVERRFTDVSEPFPLTLAGGEVSLRLDLPVGERLAARFRGTIGRGFWSSKAPGSATENVSGAPGRLLEGMHYDGTARVTIDLVEGVGAFVGVTTRRREQIIRFRSASEAEDTDGSQTRIRTAPDFSASLSGIVGLSLRTQH